jgi:hypothetical protein
MRATGTDGPWVVYRLTLHNKPTALHVVCQQAEWDALERATPGRHPLVRAGIATEAEADRLARDTPTG